MDSIKQSHFSLSDLDSPESVSSAIYSKMSFSQKWEQVCQLRETAWAMKAAGVRALHPDWSDEEVQNQVRSIFLYAVT